MARRLTGAELSAQVRREQIHALTAAGPASVDDLAVRFQVTASTIRRDLAQLHAQGRLARTYGGAMAVSPQEPTLAERLGTASEQKAAIAARALEYIRDGEVVMLDGGSSVGALARLLRNGFTDLTVVTSGLNTLQELADAEGVTVECLGGRLRGVSGSLLGPIAEHALERMTFDRTFLGADAVSADLGLCEATREQTRLKELLAHRSSHVYVLADSGKLGRCPFHAWTPWGLGWTLITDSGVDEAQRAAFAAHGVEMAVA